MTIKEFKKLLRKAGRKGFINVKIGEEIFNTDIDNCGFQIDNEGNVSLIIGVDVADVEALKRMENKNNNLNAAT